MTNDASREGSRSAGHGSHSDWESTALQRVAARHVELHETQTADHRSAPGRDWEQRALECLRRYFRTHR